MQSLASSFLEPLPQLLVQIFGSDAADATYQVLNQHNDYAVLLVMLRQPSSEVIVKLAGRASPMQAAFERTAFIHKLINTHTDVPVADIVAVDTSYSQFPWRYLIQTRLAGTVWAEIAPQLKATQKYSAYEQIGRAVAQLHSIQFPAFGEIASGEGAISFRDALMQRATQTIQPKHLLERFADVVRDHAELFDSVHEAVLCHDDLHHYNVLFQKDHESWKLSGILDFDKAWAGHSETDLARLDFWDNMMGDGFRTAYIAIHPIDAHYEQRRLIYQLLWCLEYAVPTSRHQADLQRLCEELGIAPIIL
jgi:aminoglycoside phosphotransferase (APT) family kinase protein